MTGNYFSGGHKQRKTINTTGIVSPTALKVINEFEKHGGVVIRPTKEVDPYKDFPFYKNLSKRNKK